MRTPLLKVSAVIVLAVLVAKGARAEDDHLAGTSPPPPRGEAALPRLVTGAGDAVPAPRPGVVRARPVTLDADVLDTLQPGLAVRFEPFDDVATTVVIDRVEPRSDRLVVTGTPADDAFGSLLLVHRGGATSAELRLPNRGIFRVRGDAEGFVAQELEGCDPFGCGTGPEHEIHAPAGAGGGGGVAGVCDEGDVVDVIILYTSVARQSAGGAGPIEADIAMAVEATNEAYANSGIGLQINLLLVQEASYDEDGSYADHLYRLTFGNDGIMDEAHALRDEYGADLVSLFVDDNEYCGIAWLMANVSPFFEDNGFSVVTWFCSSLVLAHEFGHNMGCHHDHDNASSSPAYFYSYGHRFNGNSGNLWRTVMSYSPGTRVAHFSNPDILFDGQPSGVPGGEPDPADNAQTIQQTRGTVANFRCSSPPIGLNVLDDRAAFETLLQQASVADFEGVPDGQLIPRPAGYEWNGLVAGAPLLQADRQANVVGGPFISDFIASASDSAPIVFDLPAGTDAVGGYWFHGEATQAGYDGLFRLTTDDGETSNYLVTDIPTGQDEGLPRFIGFVSPCGAITRVEFFALTPTNSTTAMADDVIHGSTGYGCPDNDACTAAQVVADGSTAFTTINATTDGTGDTLCGPPGNSQVSSDVWFRYFAACDKPVTVSVCGAAFDARIAIYESFCPTLVNQAMACTEDGCAGGASLSFDAEGGTTYRIRVGSGDGSQGDAMLVVESQECVPSPINDDCGDSTTIAAGSIPFSTVGATTDGPAEDGCGLDGAPQVEHDVWFRFLAACDETITVRLCDVDFEPSMALYGTPCPSTPGSALACASGACASSTQLSFDATAGTIYRLRVGGAATDQAGTGTLTLTCGVPPPSCPPDVDGSGAVDVDDLVAVILAWGGTDPNADVNADGTVDVDDLVEVILAWGPCD